MVEQSKTVIIDPGSEVCRAGFSGDNFPCSEFPSVIGKHKKLIDKEESSDSYIAKEALSKRGILKLFYPIEYGYINNWDYIEKIWHHCFFTELHIAPEKHPCLLTEVPLNPKRNREKIVQLMFETFNVPLFFLANKAVLSLLATGRKSGVIVESGESISYVVPIYNLYAITDNIKNLYFAGSDVTEYLTKLLADIGYNALTFSERQIVLDIKEKLAYASLDFQGEMKACQNQENKLSNYELPDGKILKIGCQKFQCVESMFQPYLVGKSYSGIQELVYKSIMHCDIDLRLNFFQNIVLSGGNTLIKQLEERMQKEIVNYAPSNLQINVIAPDERKYLSWIGGSILNKLSSFQSCWITQDEYNEYGPAIVHQKCF